jgi:hypothetical protein
MELVYNKLLLLFFIFKLLLDPGFFPADLITAQVPETVSLGIQGILRIKHKLNTIPKILLSLTKFICLIQSHKHFYWQRRVTVLKGRVQR